MDEQNQQPLGVTPPVSPPFAQPESQPIAPPVQVDVPPIQPISQPQTISAPEVQPIVTPPVGLPQPQPIAQPQVAPQQVNPYQQQPMAANVIPGQQPAAPVMTQPLPSNKKFPKKIILLVVGLVVVGVLGFLGMKALPNLMGKAVPKYDKLVEFKNSKASEGEGYQFSYPEQMEVQSDLSTITTMEHKVTEADRSKAGASKYSQIRAQSVFSGRSLNEAKKKEVLDTLVKEVKKVDAPSSSQEVTNVNVTDPVDKYGGKLVKITYTIQDKTSKKSNNAVAQALVVFGEERVYVFGAESTEQIWTANETSWDKIFESFKHDI